MTTNPSSTIVGVFTDRSMAEQAMQALHDAGISNEQIHYSATDSSGGLLENLKSLFTGSTGSGDFSGLGLSDEEARYYSNEYNKGNSVIAVQAPGQEENVLSVLNRYSASSYRHDLTATGAGVAPDNVVQSAAGADAANYAAPHSFTATETPPAQYAAPSVDTYSTSQSDQHVSDPIPAGSIPEAPTNGYASTATSTDNSTNSTSTGMPVEEGVADEYQRPAIGPDDSYVDAASTPTDSSVIDYEQTPLVDADAANSPVTTANDVIAPPESDALPASSGATDSDTTPVNSSDAAAESGALPVAEGDVLPIAEDDALPIAESPAATLASDDSVPGVQDDALAPSTSDATLGATSDAFVNNDTIGGSEMVPASNGAQVASTDGQDYDDVIARQQTDKLVGKDDSVVQADQDVPPLENQQETDPDVYEARVRDAQSQLQDYQQQLRDARARLQTAKHREMQLQASHQRYQEVQTQLQSVQSELEATLAELKQTQSRIDQYR
ncbi:MAG: hypothetical protein M3Y39_06940 [Chloroflexota bacterium]|nr:hypothetical protein [Chloroflexota bacterium]